MKPVYIYVFIQQGCLGEIKAQEVRCARHGRRQFDIGRQIFMPSLVLNNKIKMVFYWKMDCFFIERFNSQHNNARMGAGKTKSIEGYGQGEKVVCNCG